jgi:hypothetical protein
MEQLRDILTVRKLASEVGLKTEQFEKLMKVTDLFLEELLPK